MNRLRQLVPKPIRNFVKGIKIITARVNSRPIFVLGNQKSGTTAISELLGEMVGLSVSRDLRKELGNPSFHLVHKGDLSLSEFIEINKLDFTRDIIKEPNLTLLYQYLLEYFPESKFVFVLRDPRDNIRSILNRLRIPGNLFQLNQKHRQEITPAWDLIMDSRWLGLEGENYIEMLAARWNLIVNVYLENQERIFLIRYEEFLKDKIGELEVLAQKLKLLPVNDITDKLDFQFQSYGNRSLSKVKWIDFFGKDNLARIEHICGERMILLGYSLSQEHSQ